MPNSLSALTYPLGENEDERLAEILRYDYADAGPQNNLDQLCLLAQSLFNVPVALVTLVGKDEQTFLAKCGVNSDGTPRKDAFCTYTILNDNVFVVTDATTDHRFVENPLVTGEMHIRFYAGAPLVLRPGVRLGAFCLIDTKPRTFTEAEAAQLQRLAEIAVNELRRRRMMIDLRREQDLLAQTARMTKAGSWTLDIATDVVTWSEETYRIFGVDPAVMPTWAMIESFWAPGSVKSIAKAMKALLADGQAFDREYQIVTIDGSIRWVRCIAEAESAGGEIVRLVGSLQDITQQRDHAAEVERLAYRDALTGLPNRALFQQRFRMAVEEAKATGGKVGLVMLDLDHFKDVNDTLGHDAGDALLRSVSERLNQAFRTTDTIARLGGDEFAVIVSGVTDVEDLIRPTRVLMDLLRHPLEHSGKALSISASIGVALYPQHDQTPAQLLKDADIALYRAKNAGRNRVVAFEPEMREEVERRTQILREARAGIEAKQFELFYQPLVSVRPPRRVTGFEALMRWRHPERGVLTPDKFLPALEDQELSLALGEVALDTAMLQMRAWMEQKLDFGRVAVNLSGSQFRTGDLTETVAAKLKHWGVPADRLTLEVTENVYMGWSSDVVADTIKALHDMGVKIALDDFGTGYASLANLQQFPIDKLKIDKSFVQKEENAAIVQAVLTLGSSMGMKVIAEGVENASQLEELEAMGCDQAQGYYFAKPMPALDVPGFLRGFERQIVDLARNVA